MKNILIVLSLLCICMAALAGENTAIVTAPVKEGPLRFAANEIESELKGAGWIIAPNQDAVLKIAIEFPNGAEMPESKPESFVIDVAHDAGRTHVRVSGADVRGVMYGGLDVAEQIRLYGPLSIKSKTEVPYLSVRAMKFNPPLKGNVYMSEEDQKNSAWFYDLQYWDRFLRTMAYNRYNALTFWSSHPYDQMVRLQKYPEATTLPQDQLDINIAHFHKLFQMAKDYEIDTYLVTWNIHMSPGFKAAHKVQDGQDSPLIRDYQKECIKALLREYPELTGLGTCPGEKMPMSAAANAEWIRDVYLDTLAKTGRKMPFIYRYWGARPKETAEMLVEAKYPGEILLDIKFNGEHMYSSTKPHPEEMQWLTQAQRPYKFLWHLRNDCIFQLRWGDPEFAGEVLHNCGGAESGGFVMGSEIEIPGEDRYHTPQTVDHRDWKYEFEKNWMRFAVWGRMGYNPKESDAYWIGRFSERFGSGAGEDVFLALKYSSKIIPLATSFHWNYMNGDWYPEGNVGKWNTSEGMKIKNFRDRSFFHDIREWIFTNVIDESMMNIPDYVATCIVKGEKASEGVLTPLQVAAKLNEYVEASEKYAQAAATNIEKGTKEWQCTQLDLQASCALGRYYAEKIRAAVDLMIYLATGDETRKSAAILSLEKAREHWKTLATVTKSHYVTHEVWLEGRFDWAMYLPAVEKDIDLACQAKPWEREEEKQTLPNGRNITVSTGWRAKDWPKEIEPWVKEFNSRALGRPASLDVSYFAQTLLDKAGRKDVVLEINPSLGHREAFQVQKQVEGCFVQGGSPAGLIYGVQALLAGEATDAVEKPAFDIRGTTLCLMRNPAGKVSGMPPQTYASVLSKETFPWFYDKQHLERFLDAMVAARLNTLFVWSGHLFPYILEMPKYPEACELTNEQLRENQEQFRWLTAQCARRNIAVLLHFYNIHVSQPMADAHHFKPEPPKFLNTRPSLPTPLLKEYVRYALSRFFEEFDSVGLYVCPGESLKPEYQLEWFRDVIFAAAKQSGKEPLMVVRDWHLSADLRSQLKTLYPNIYSEMKQNNESLTSPVPDRLHTERWKGVAKAHVVNLHGPPMDLQPMRWGSPLFIHEIVSEWKKLGFVHGAELYTLAFWLWPYTRDKLEPQQEGPTPAGRRLLWLDRDSIYLDAFGRYLWKIQRNPEAEQTYWEQYLAQKFGSQEAGHRVYRWYVLTGPISPGMQNLTATKFQNHWSTVVLQNQGVDFILKARTRIDEVPTADGTKSMDHYSMPVDTYFFERYKSKYGLPQLTQRVSMPVAQYAAELAAGREVSDAMTPDRICELLCELAAESLAEAQAAQAHAKDPAIKEELGRFVTDSQMYELATEAFRQKVLAALVKGQMLASGDTRLAKPFLKHMEDSVAVYEKLADLTSRTYLSGNDLWPWKHWKVEGLAEFQDDLQTQRAWLQNFLAKSPSQQ